MPFDPTKPAFGSPDSSAEMRAQPEAAPCLRTPGVLFSAP